jgi:NAD/NADP octopine/nopaline dehydrogenase, alpha-helical domain
VNRPTRVLICGTGSGAHVLGAVISARPDVEVRVFTLNAVRAEEWRQITDCHELRVTVRADEPTVISAQGLTITSNPRFAARGADVVLVSVPAFMHLPYLVALEPYLEDGCVIVGLPGQTGFEFDVREALGCRLGSCLVINFESLPWICKRDEFGRSAKILGAKARLVGAMQGDPTAARIDDPLAALQRLIGGPPELVISGHPLGITLRSPNAYSHPPIMFGRWKNWDGHAVRQPPLFYQGIDEETAELLDGISEEVVATSRRIMADHPGVDLSQVIPMYDWDIGCYGDDIRDKTNLMTALRTNAGYEGITHPMIRLAGGEYVPDFQHRFLAEDVPYGLVVVRGVAELAGVPTPHLDRVLCWSQSKMGKQYLVGKRLSGRDLDGTRCPQRYGFTIDDILVA